MLVKQQKQVECEVITDVLCDSCGKSCVVDSLGVPLMEYMKLEARWGYGSSFDGESWFAHLCESCVRTKLGFISFTKESIFPDESKNL